jgi:hypothetical protein
LENEIRVKTGKKYVRALDIETGKIVWEIQQTGPVEGKRWAGVLATAGGILIYANPDGDLVAVDQKDGKRLWHIPTNETIKSARLHTPPAGVNTSRSRPAPISCASAALTPMLNRRNLLRSFGSAALGLAGGAEETLGRFRVWDNHCHLSSVPGDTPEKTNGRVDPLRRSIGNRKAHRIAGFRSELASHGGTASPGK